MEINEIRKKIFLEAQLDYKKFQSKLIPGEHQILGVRIPFLKSLAKEISKSEWKEYLANGPEEYFEDIMLKGLVICFLKVSCKDMLVQVSNFIPKISNWAVCDSFCMGLKMAKKNQSEFWDFILPYAYSKNEFEARFASVMMLSHFINEDYIDRVLNAYKEISNEGYYSKMAVAWGISVCYAKQRDKTHSFLLSGALDDFTFNKAIQKSIESLRVSSADKLVLRKMKR